MFAEELRQPCIQLQQRSTDARVKDQRLLACPLQTMRGSTGEGGGH